MDVSIKSDYMRNAIARLIRQILRNKCKVDPKIKFISPITIKRIEGAADQSKVHLDVEITLSDNDIEHLIFR